MSAIHLARDAALAGCSADLSHLRKRNARPGGQCDGKAADRVRTRTDGFRKADRDVVDAVADEQRGYRFAADAGLNDGGDVGNVDAESRGGFPVHPHLDLWQRRLLVDGHVRRAGNFLEKCQPVRLRYGAVLPNS